MLRKLRSRRGVSLVEVLVSAALLGMAAYSVSKQLGQGFRSTRNVIGLKAVSQIKEAIPKAVFRTVTNYFRTAGPGCSAAGLRAALSRDFGNGVRIVMPNGPLAAVPAEHLVAAARCARPFAPNVNLGRSFYFCVLFQPALGPPPRDSLIAMQPAFGEFVFQANNVTTSLAVGCNAATANPTTTGASMSYTLHWGEATNAHRFAGTVSETRI